MPNITPPISEYIKQLPEVLQASVTCFWEKYQQALLDKECSLSLPEAECKSWIKVWACSDFVADQCITKPEVFQQLINSQDCHREYAKDDYQTRLKDHLQEVDSEESLMKALRQFRQREMLRIIWRDLNKVANLSNTTMDLSNMADVCVQLALDKLQAWLYEEYGVPKNTKGQTQQLIVIAMGKLGAQELNLSSDIDLIFCYPETGNTRGGKSIIDNEHFFQKLARQLIKVLHSVTADGFVFRVDMRLRPYGDSGPLVMSFQALENYYQGHGRCWERYACVKARPITGDSRARHILFKMLHAFVYRRYLDYSVIEELRQIKLLIQREEQTRGLASNIKLGSGGIREIEFIGQVLQLIHAGHELHLRERNIVHALELLAKAGYLKNSTITRLKKAYTFLRNIEHCLQAISDRQTHDLPESELDKARLIWVLGYRTWQAFYDDLKTHRQRVHEYFNLAISQPKVTQQLKEDEVKQLADLKQVWLKQSTVNKSIEYLQRAGFDQGQSVLLELEHFRESRRFRGLRDRVKNRLDELIPVLLVLSGKQEHVFVAFNHALNFLTAIMNRGSYLSFLLENPEVLSELVLLCGASERVALYLQNNPILLDALRFYGPLELIPNIEALTDELRQSLLPIPAEDLEEQMAALHRFKQIQVLRVSAADIKKNLPIMKVSDHLTAIAIVILKQVQAIAWQSTVNRYGHPGEDEFAIVAYGKLGGLELAYSSDLDLVFIHDQDDLYAQTDGVTAISAGEFYTKLGQRIIHILNTHTATGRLYEIDLQLRPSGSAGLLVTGMQAFATYQMEQAWSWEHQALVRARMISGSKTFQERFSRLRHDALAQVRDRDELTKRVIEMRRKMRQSVGICPNDQFDLKQGLGGIIDIEFIVQFCVLMWTHQYPSLIEYTDNIRILEAIGEAQLIPETDRKLLSDAYIVYRDEVHRLTLQKKPPLVSNDKFLEYRQLVEHVWDDLGLK